ncbi:MAG: TetR/AcrR family transcriptional regulator [Gemmatimonadota bacterium]|nr:TetR/AcrR family transcriptional regulator [Gemmatimonadota bacterium]
MHRLRLLEGFAAVVSERGYATTTIAQIVKHARVSKRTFYEHFADKEECFLALYEEAAELLRLGVEQALLAPASSWEQQLDAGLDSYLTALESNPVLTRVCLLEIRAAGPRALELRLRGRARLAAMLRAFVERTRREHPEQLRSLSEAMATAVVGGIDELLLENVQPGAKSNLSETRATAAELIRAVVRLPSA